MKMKKPPGRFKALVLSLLGVDLAGSEMPVELPGIGTVSHDAAMKLDTVWACVRLISESIATLPLSIYERTSNGARVATQHPLHFILHNQPNPDATASVFLESFVACMLLRGNGYAEKLMVGERIVGLDFLHPDRMLWNVDANGARRLQYRNGDGTYRTIPLSRVWHVPGFSMDGRTGLSVIQYGAHVFGSAIAANNVARGVFERGLTQTTALKMPGVLREDQRDEARESLRRISGSVNAGKSVVLEGGTEIEIVGINPNDAQLLETRAFNVESICRWFRVPPFMVGHTEKSTSWGSGIEQQMIGFLTFTLGPWIRRLEQGISKDLLRGDARHYPKFSVEGLLRADSAARSAFYSVMVNNGIMTRDEVRELEELAPMGGNAAVLTVQTALAPLDTIGAAQPQQDESRTGAVAAIEAVGSIASGLAGQLRAQSERPVQVAITQEPMRLHLTQADTHVHIAAEASEPAPAPVVNVYVDPPQVHVDVQPPQVTVEPAEVNVSLEATMPAPEVTVHLPPRKTETEIQRDSAGRISHTTQTERDA